MCPSSESVPHAKKRSSATYCSLPPFIFSILLWMNMSRMKSSCVLTSSVCQWGIVKISCNFVFSNAGCSAGLWHHQLPELWESGGLVQHGEEGQRRVWYPACCLPDWEQKWEIHIREDTNSHKFVVFQLAGSDMTLNILFIKTGIGLFLLNENKLVHLGGWVFHSSFVRDALLVLRVCVSVWRSECLMVADVFVRAPDNWSAW